MNFEVFCYPPHCNGEQKTGNLKKDKAAKTRSAIIQAELCQSLREWQRKLEVIDDSSLEEALDAECLRKNRKRNPPSEPLKYSDSASARQSRTYADSQQGSAFTAMRILDNFCGHFQLSSLKPKGRKIPCSERRIYRVNKGRTQIFATCFCYLFYKF